jgi:hypothetical protein
MAQKMAGGGVVAVAQGGSSATLSQLGTLADTDLTETPEQRMGGIKGALPGIQEMYGPSATAPYMEEIKKERAGLSKMTDQGEGLAFLSASQALLRPGSKSRAVAGAMGAFGTEIVKMDKEKREADRMLRQSELTLATADQARKDGQIGKAESLFDKAQDLKEKGLTRQLSAAEKEATVLGGIKQAQIGASATLGRKTDLDRLIEAQHAKLLESGEPDNAATKALASERGANLYGKMAGSARVDIADTTAREKAADAVNLTKREDAIWKDAKKNKDAEGMRTREEQLITQRMGKKSEGQGGPAPVQQQPQISAPPTKAIGILKGNPSAQNRAYFDQTFGAGAAARSLGE